jgi:plastocyanin
MKKHILLFILIISGLVYHSGSYAVTHIIHVGNFYFTPSSLNVNVGDIIRWEWDAGSHTTTSGIIPAGADDWDEIISSANQDFEYDVDFAGVYNYVCTPHAGMGQVGTFTAAAAAPTLSVTPSNQNVPAGQGQTIFAVNSNSNWTVTSNASWCTVPSSGSGNNDIEAEYTENTSLVQRVATISISVTGLPVQMVTVTQAGTAATLSVSPPSQNVAQSAGTTAFTVNSNTNWSASSDATWCNVNPSGSGNGQISASYTANPTFAVRIATISVSVPGLPVQTVTVVQAGSTVGMGENKEQAIQIYPNPSRGLFKVSMENTSESTEISLIDISGRTISTGSVSGSDGMTFDLSESPRGYYFVRIRNEAGTAVRRIVLID